MPIIKKTTRILQLFGAPTLGALEISRYNRQTKYRADCRTDQRQGPIPTAGYDLGATSHNGCRPNGRMATSGIQPRRRAVLCRKTINQD